MDNQDNKIMTPLEYIRSVEEDSGTVQFNEYDVALYIEQYNEYVVDKLANSTQDDTSLCLFNNDGYCGYLENNCSHQRFENNKIKCTQTKI